MLFRRSECTFYVFLLLVQALTLQAMIPAGFMPGQSEAGTLQIEICTATGLKTIARQSTGDTQNGQNTPVHVLDYCAFAFLAHKNFILQKPQSFLYEKVKSAWPVQASYKGFNPRNIKIWHAQAPPHFLQA